MELAKKTKVINGWAITSERSEFGNQGDVVLIRNNEDGKRVITRVPYGPDWYFYVSKADKVVPKLKKIGFDRVVEGEEWIRVYYPRMSYDQTDLKDKIKALEDVGIKTFEADLGPHKRLCLDYDIRIEDWENIRVLYFDIETDDRNEGIVIGRDEILSFGAVDRDGNEYYLVNDGKKGGEKRLLEEISKLIRQWDMLIGWNSRGFDMPYIRDRMKANGIYDSYIWRILHEDMMMRVQYFYSKDPKARQNLTSYSLEFVSQYFLKKGKIQHKESIHELWSKHPKRFKDYNMQDCRLLLELEKELGLMDVTYKMFQWCQVFARDWSMVKAIDNYILSEANKRGIHYPTNMNYMGQEAPDVEQYLGAFVVDPVPGYYENVYDFDFKSLYPNIIRTFNISPESITDEGICTPGVDKDGKRVGNLCFNRKRKGIIPSKMSKLLDERADIRAKMKGLDKSSDEYRNLNVKQLVVKELANSIYGVLGNKWFRSFSIDLAESITATGQYLIKYLQEHFDVLYGDTDSVFLRLEEGEDPQRTVDKINKMIRFHLEKEFGVKDCHIIIELDQKFDKFLIETKKKYVGSTDGKMKYVGMESIKRDTIKIAAEAQRDLVEAIFGGATVKELHTWVERLRHGLMEGPTDKEMIILRKKVGKALDDYKGTPPVHVRVARAAKADYLSGDIVPYIVLSGGAGAKMEAIDANEFTGEWDRTYYWNRILYPIVQRMLEVAQPKEDWEQYKIKKSKKK